MTTVERHGSFSYTMATERPSEALKQVVSAYVQRRLQTELKGAGHGYLSHVARATGFKPGTLSTAAAGKRGVGLDLADALAAFWRIGGYAELVELAKAWWEQERARDLTADEFIMRVASNEKLLDALGRNPGRWAIGTLADAVRTDLEKDEDGVPAGGWEAVLDQLQPDPTRAPPVLVAAAPVTRRHRASRRDRPDADERPAISRRSSATRKRTG